MGVESAMLAARGYTGPAHIIDGKEGLFHVFSHAVSRGSPCTFDAEGLIRELPRRADDAWRIERCSMKSFPVEALMHSPLSAIRQIRASRDFAASDIREVRVEVIARAADILGDPAKYRPTTRETADHSLPYSIAALLADGVLGPAQFDENRVRDPRLVPLMDSVKVVANEAFEARFPASQPSRVTITLLDGSRHAAEVEYPKGDPRNPLTWDEIDTKFRSLARGVIEDDTVERVRDGVLRLDAITARQLCEALTPQSVAAH
jgi:2-methylcitrate dehydratase